MAALPTITPVRMAALLPGASSSFAVVAGKSCAAAQIEGSILTGLVDRQKLLRAKHPDAADIALGERCKLGTPKIPSEPEADQEMDSAPIMVDEVRAKRWLGDPLPACPGSRPPARGS